MLRIPANIISQAETLTTLLKDDEVLRLRNGKLATGEFKGTKFQRFKGMLVKIFWPPTNWKKNYLKLKQATYEEVSRAEKEAFAQALATSISKRTPKPHDAGSSQIRDVKQLLERTQEERNQFDTTVKIVTDAVLDPSPMLGNRLDGAKVAADMAIKSLQLSRVAQVQQLRAEVTEKLTKAGVEYETISTLDEALDDQALKLSLFNVAKEYARRAYSPPAEFSDHPAPEDKSTKSSQTNTTEQNDVKTSSQQQTSMTSNEGTEVSPEDSLYSEAPVLQEESSKPPEEPAVINSLEPEQDSIHSENTVLLEESQKSSEELSISTSSKPKQDSLESEALLTQDESTESPEEVLYRPHNPGKDMEDEWDFRGTLTDKQRKQLLKKQSPAMIAARQLFPKVDTIITADDIPKTENARFLKIARLKKLDEEWVGQTWAAEAAALLEDRTEESDKMALLLEHTNRVSEAHRELQKKKIKAVDRLGSYFPHRRWNASVAIGKLETDMGMGEGTRSNSFFPHEYRNLASETISRPLYYDNVQLSMGEAIERTITMLKNTYPTLASKGSVFRVNELREHLQAFLSDRKIEPADVPTTTFASFKKAEEDAELPEASLTLPESDHLETVVDLPSEGKEFDSVSLADSGVETRSSNSWDVDELDVDLEGTPPLADNSNFRETQKDDGGLFRSDSTGSTSPLNRQDDYIPPFNATEPPPDDQDKP